MCIIIEVLHKVFKEPNMAVLVSHCLSFGAQFGRIKGSNDVHLLSLLWTNPKPRPLDLIWIGKVNEKILPYHQNALDNT